MFPYVDCQGLAGAWTLGTVQTGGFELIHRASLKGGFGDQIVDSNRPMLRGDWFQDDGIDADSWTPVQCAYLNGTPPCSGFSLLNVTAAAARKAGKDAPDTGRGIDSAINDCMKELVKYAGRCRGSDGKQGPEIVSFESVQGAGKEGRPLMVALRDNLSRATGHWYSVSHVFMSGSTIGAAQMRHRYYVVFHRIPFGVDPPEPRRVCTYQDAIGDLQHLDLTWDEQSLLNSRPEEEEDWWLYEQNILRADALVDAHVTYGDDNDRSNHRRVYLDEFLPRWTPGQDREDVFRKYIAEHGTMPPGCEKWWDWENDRIKGFNGPGRIRPDRPGYVLTGGAVGQFFHWNEDRFLTVRECARLMGYPDGWSFKTASGVNQASSWIGKCCPVQSGRWISSWILRALEGTPGAALERLEDREFIHNSTQAYKKWPKEISNLPADFR